MFRRLPALLGVRELMPERSLITRSPRKNPRLPTHAAVSEGRKPSVWRGGKLPGHQGATPETRTGVGKASGKPTGASLQIQRMWACISSCIWEVTPERSPTKTWIPREHTCLTLERNSLKAERMGSPGRSELSQPRRGHMMENH